MQDIAIFGLRFLQMHYPERLLKRYELTEMPEEMVLLFDKIGGLRGCLGTGGEIDYDKTAELIVRDLRMQNFGVLTFDLPEMPETSSI